MAIDIGRRRLLAAFGGAAVVWPLAARAQQPIKVWRVGYLATASRQAVSNLYARFIQGMHELGHVEGSDFVVDLRSAEGSYDRLSGLAAELVDLKADVLLAGTIPAVRALQGATTHVPIVMAYSTDPVGNALVASLGHPGGNTTGLASSSDDTAPKQLELLTMTKPHLERVGLLGNPNSGTSLAVRKSIEAVTRKTGMSVVPVEARSPEEIDRAFAMLTAAKAQAVIATGDAVFFQERKRITELALRSLLPSMFSQREYVVAGGLMSYGENLADFFYRAAFFVDKIFKGVKPADLPIEQPTRFHLVINSKTASALGLTIPSQLNMFADEVIE